MSLNMQVGRVEAAVTNFVEEMTRHGVEVRSDWYVIMVGRANEIDATTAQLVYQSRDLAARLNRLADEVDRDWEPVPVPSLSDDISRGAASLKAQWKGLEDVIKVTYGRDGLKRFFVVYGRTTAV